MIHDTDLIDVLVTQLQAGKWLPGDLTADIRRVWGGDVHASQLIERRLLVQLWPQDGQKQDRLARAGAWSLSVMVSVGFYLRVSSQTMAEVDSLMHALDELVVAEWWNVLNVQSLDKSETELFCRESSLTWSLRPSRDSLQRLAPEDDQERYSGTVQAQCDMAYRRL